LKLNKKGRFVSVKIGKTQLVDVRTPWDSVSVFLKLCSAIAGVLKAACLLS